MANIQDEILNRLDFIKKNKKRQGYMKPKEYTEFMPATMGYEPRDTSLAYDRLDKLDERGQIATQTAETIQRAERARQNMIRRRRELQRTKNMLAQARRAQPNYNPNIVGGGFYGDYEGRRNFGKRWGKDNTPEVSDIRRLNPSAGLVTMNYRGHNVTVNRQVKDIFVAFLDDLYKTGYRPVSIGGYSNRNIAGTNTKSLHSYGFAIDIDPQKNPVQHGGSNRNALPPGIGALAAKYGLSWGGNWNSYKDPMHFSVPYGGRE